LLFGPYFAQNFASKFGQGLILRPHPKCNSTMLYITWSTKLRTSKNTYLPRSDAELCLQTDFHSSFLGNFVQTLCTLTFSVTKQQYMDCPKNKVL